LSGNIDFSDKQTTGPQTTPDLSEQIALKIKNVGYQVEGFGCDLEFAALEIRVDEINRQVALESPGVSQGQALARGIDRCNPPSLLGQHKGISAGAARYIQRAAGRDHFDGTLEKAAGPVGKFSPSVSLVPVSHAQTSPLK
jgi:hypothetical protein